MRLGFLVAPAIAALLGSSQPQRGTPTSITIDLLDDRRVVSRVISSELLLRLQNVSAGNEHEGWDVQVLHRPVRVDSRDLIHQAPHGPDPSDVEAWHVAEKFFPNERLADVKGYPITIRIQLIEPRVSGKNAGARFVSGKLRVSWEPRR
jgi:hypothetical protein